MITMTCHNKVSDHSDQVAGSFGFTFKYSLWEVGGGANVLSTMSTMKTTMITKAVRMIEKTDINVDTNALWMSTGMEVPVPASGRD